MQYNKYALALALLASSAFAASLVPAPSYDKLVAHVMSASESNKKFEDISEEKKTLLETNMKSDDSDDYYNAIAASTDVLDGAKIKQILEKVYNDKVSKIEEEIKTKAGNIISKANGTKISETPFSEYDGLLIEEQYNSIDEYEYKSGNALKENDLVNFLKGNSLPSSNCSNEDIATRILKLADSKKISEITDRHRKFDLSDNKFDEIKNVENAIERALSKEELLNYLDKNNFMNLDNDAKVKVISTLSGTGKIHEYNDLSKFVEEKFKNAIAFQEKSERISNEKLKEILGANDELLDSLSKDPVTPAPVDDENALNEKIRKIMSLTQNEKVGDHTDLLAQAGNNSNIVAAIKNQESILKSKISEDVLKAILTADETKLAEYAKPVATDGGADTNGEKEANAAEAAESTNSTDPDAELKKVVDAVVTAMGDGKFAEISEEKLKELNLTEKHRAALKAANPDKSGDIMKILKDADAAAPAAEEAKTAKTSNDNPKAVEDLKPKIDALLALVENGKMKTLTEQQIKDLKLNEKQVTALMAASDLSEPNIKKILESHAEEVTSSTGDNQSNSATASPWYTNKWVIGVSVVVLLAAIGGGAYMMTHKTEETDL